MKIYWGNILKQLRKDYGLTQDDIAGVLHVSRQVYGYIESGKKQPTPEDLVILSNIYDIELFNYISKSMPEDMVAEQQEFKLAIAPKSKVDKSTHIIRPTKPEKNPDNYIDPMEILTEDEINFLRFDHRKNNKRKSRKR